MIIFGTVSSIPWQITFYMHFITVFVILIHTRLLRLKSILNVYWKTCSGEKICFLNVNEWEKKEKCKKDRLFNAFPIITPDSPDPQQ